MKFLLTALTTYQLIYFWNSSIVSASGSVHEEIIQWWNKNSVQKPIKCTMNPSYLSPVNELAMKLLENAVWKPILYSKPCDHNDILEHFFSYKGKYNDNGEFEGPGKLKMNLERKSMKHSPGELKMENKTCIQQNSETPTKKLSEVVGTFKNGSLEGIAKVKYSDNTTFISNFEHGHPVGMKRTWTSNNNLHDFFYWEGYIKSIAWTRTYDYLIGMNSSFIRDEAHSSLCILVPLDTSKEILVGNVNHILQTVEDIYSADVKISSEKENCFMHLDWKIKEKKDFKLILNGNIRVPLFSYRTDPLCNKFQHNKDKPEQTYLAWEKLINDERTLKGVQTLFHLQPEMSPMDPSKVKQKFMSNVTYISEGVDILVNMSIWEGPIATWVGSRVAFDTNGNLHGLCQFRIRHEFINKTGQHNFLDWSLKFISGEFVHGKLQGHAFLTTWRGVGIVATFKDGELHGPIHSMGRKFLFDVEKRGFKFRAHDKNHVVGRPGAHFIGHFQNGQAVGHFWLGLVNNGFIHGMVDENGQVTGDDLVFIYPDGNTALKGWFENTYMKNARNVEVKDYGCDDRGLLIATEFTEPLSDYEFFYDPCTNESWGAGNSKDIQDPFELKNVNLSMSSVPNSGEGVFARRDLPKLKPASFYSMFFFTKEQNELYKEQCTYNISKSSDYRRGCKKYSLGLSTFDALIDLKPELDVNPLPNLGPKVNHHFRFNNSAYQETDHPVWGAIQSVTPTFDIKAGMELHTHYGYGRNDFPNDFPWYWETKLVLEREERLNEIENEKKNVKKSKRTLKPKKTKKSKDSVK